ncbi:hypothetical protein Cgig2_029164 [Carnegiea gigantea]|uniref:Uncharacterized protein n=1 Tax=Carnegiea gigantea TaxID=171969 RepID=A0A9Q1KL71_9CARY|nr:hypothetical protein Cgig2_029164 [Carnegiea gigantea]
MKLLAKSYNPIYNCGFPLSSVYLCAKILTLSFYLFFWFGTYILLILGISVENAIILWFPIFFGLFVWFLLFVFIRRTLNNPVSHSGANDTANNADCRRVSLLSNPIALLSIWGRRRRAYSLEFVIIERLLILPPVMALAGSLQFSPLLGVCRNREPGKHLKYVAGRANQHLWATALSSCASRQDLWSCVVSAGINRPICSLPHRCNVLRCHSFMFFGQNITIPTMKTSTVALTRSCNALQGSSLVTKLVPAVGIILFALWGLRPLMRMSRNLLLHVSLPSPTLYRFSCFLVEKNRQQLGEKYNKLCCDFISATYTAVDWCNSYLQVILSGAPSPKILKALDPIAMPTEASQLVKQRLLTFVKSLSTVLAFAYCLSSAIQQVQRFLMETNDPTDARNLGFQFAGKALYTAVWVAAFSLFMELLGFSTQKWLTAGGLGTVLLTLAGREIFTNFLSSAMIHATRPFVVNDWIQTKIEGYEVSGFVEHVGWWSPTIIRGEDREAVHIPNHKFTVNVVRNLSQKTHWRIKTHLAISHLDVGKINSIVADMRKVLAKNPQIEQQRLHRRVFLENIDPENQALLTSHFEEYLCVKEAVLLDLLRVIRHHRARLATPIRTIQKVYDDVDLDSISFPDTIFSRAGPASRRQLLLLEPSHKINGEDKSKSQARSVRTSGEQESGSTGQTSSTSKADNKVRGSSTRELNTKESSRSGNKDEEKVAETLNAESTDENKAVGASKLNPKSDGKATAKSVATPSSKSESSAADSTPSDLKPSGLAPGGSVSKNSESHGVNEKSSGSVSGSHSKQAEKLVSESPKSAPASLEENIVLGVALEGSKRTLPIEEELDSPPTSAEAKELATRGNGHGNSSSQKDEKDK